MNPAEEIDKYKNTIINIAVVIVGLIIALNIYQGGLGRIKSMEAKISEEENKNRELEKISQLESKKNSYKELFSKQEANSVMADISKIAKAANVSVVSVKPLAKESSADYSKDIFEITVNASSYDNLAEFINAIESYNNVYIVEGLKISIQEGIAKKGLAANLLISSVTITNQ